MKYDRLGSQLSNGTSECRTWCSFGRERQDDIINFRASLNACRNKYKSFEGQIAVFQPKIEAVAFARDACCAKVGRVGESLSRYLDACSYVAKRLSDKEVYSEAGRAASAIQAENEVIHFPSGFVLSINDFVGRHIAHALDFVSQRSLTVVEVIWNVENELHEIVSVKSVSEHGLLSAGHVN